MLPLQKSWRNSRLKRAQKELPIPLLHVREMSTDREATEDHGCPSCTEEEATVDHVQNIHNW